MKAKRVVITGMGAVSPYGFGAKLFLENVLSGRSALGLRDFEGPTGNHRFVVGEVPPFDLTAILPGKEGERVPRLVPLAIAAAREALSQSLMPGIQDLESSRQLGVLVGTGGGGIDFAERQYAQYYGEKNSHVTPYAISSSLVGMLSSEISIALGLRGLSHVISTGCTSSTDAMGYAFHSIRCGSQKILLTGGAESCITSGMLAGFARMKVISTNFSETPEKASRPFDLKREGFVLSEGAWIFVFEELDHAVERGAPIFGEILGYASTCDAYHRVMASQDGVEPARAMQLALQDAGLKADQVQYINLHGTSTKMNDKVETLAVKLAFGNQAFSLSSSSTKSMIGHPQGACGAAGLMAALPALQDQKIHPTANYEYPDPDCDLDYTPLSMKKRDVDFALCNTIAFGSKNSCLVVGR